ncbi:hypothetical protein [Pseudomonas sp. RU47]|uniref:hypothetical protein n=1 Tax=Pseudomonas sp. RU47 TaxID=2005388 RepID=UPI001EE928D9|nr:hypothetical protein [Pseudomonas sp. RU47]
MPDREILVSRAWGDVPVSYIQDQESFNDCSFLDLKVNKWELNKKWSAKQNSELWIRIEKLKGVALDDFLYRDGSLWPVDMAEKTLIIIELDEGGSALDHCLLLRLVSVFLGQFRVYRWSDGIEEVSEEIAASLPAQQTVLERLIRCEQASSGK